MGGDRSGGGSRRGGRKFRRAEFLQREPRVCVTLGGGLLIPVNRLRAVLGQAFADFVAVAEIELRGRIPIVGGAFIPANGFAEILGDALAAVIKDAQRKLGVGMTLFRSGADPVRGHGVVLFRTFPVA